MKRPDLQSNKYWSGDRFLGQKFIEDNDNYIDQLESQLEKEREEKEKIQDELIQIQLNEHYRDLAKNQKDEKTKTK